MGVYYSATPPTIQHQECHYTVDEVTYLRMGEDACAEMVRQKLDIPVWVRPKVRKGLWSGYEFSFSWYQIVTDGD
jgi:hypothetical protein